MKRGRRNRPEMLGDKPISKDLVGVMNSVAVGLDKIFNGDAKGRARKTGFVLMVYPFNDEGGIKDPHCNYISNGADRKDVVTLMKEMIARFEGQPEMTGRA